MEREILNTSDLELLIDDVRTNATAKQKRVMEDEMRSLPFHKRLATACKIIFKR